jgi:hypothetical protein
MTPACRVIVYLRDDLRVRLVATFVLEFIDHGTVMIRVRMDQGDGDNACLDFDREVVNVAKIVRLDRNVDDGAKFSPRDAAADEAAIGSLYSAAVPNAAKLSRARSRSLSARSRSTVRLKMDLLSRFDRSCAAFATIG